MAKTNHMTVKSEAEKNTEVIGVISDARFWYIPDTEKNHNEPRGKLCLRLDYRHTANEFGFSGGWDSIGDIKKIQSILKESGIDFGQCYVSDEDLGDLVDRSAIFIRDSKGNHKFDRFYDSKFEENKTWEFLKWEKQSQ